MRGLVLAAVAAVGMAGVADDALAVPLQGGAIVASLHGIPEGKVIFRGDGWALYDGERWFSERVTPRSAGISEGYGDLMGGYWTTYFLYSTEGEPQPDNRYQIDLWAAAWTEGTPDTPAHIPDPDDWRTATFPIPFDPYPIWIFDTHSVDSEYGGFTSFYYELGDLIGFYPVPVPAAAPMLLTGAAALWGLRRIRAWRR